MGRPIKKKFFGNTNVAISGEGVGGEGFATVAVRTTGTLYSTSTSYTWTASAPQIAGGQAASGTLSIGTDRRVTAFNVSNAGSGYTSTSSVTLTVSPATTGTAANYVVTLSTATFQNAISLTSFLTTGSSAISGGDIIKQESSRRYLVRNAQGIGQVKIGAGVGAGHTLTAGNAHIIATDFGGSTYYVMKLTARKAVLQSRTGTSTALVSLTNDGTAIVGTAKWTLGAATGTTVTISNV
jgi:hypothetical protein